LLTSFGFDVEKNLSITELAQLFGTAQGFPYSTDDFFGASLEGACAMTMIENLSRWAADWTSTTYPPRGPFASSQVLRSSRQHAPGRSTARAAVIRGWPSHAAARHSRRSCRRPDVVAALRRHAYCRAPIELNGNGTDGIPHALGLDGRVAHSGDRGQRVRPPALPPAATLGPASAPECRATHLCRRGERSLPRRPPVEDWMQRARHRILDAAVAIAARVLAATRTVSAPIPVDGYVVESSPLPSVTDSRSSSSRHRAFPVMTPKKSSVLYGKPCAVPKSCASSVMDRFFSTSKPNE